MTTPRSAPPPLPAAARRSDDATLQDVVCRDATLREAIPQDATLQDASLIDESPGQAEPTAFGAVEDAFFAAGDQIESGTGLGGLGTGQVGIRTARVRVRSAPSWRLPAAVAGGVAFLVGGVLFAATGKTRTPEPPAVTVAAVTPPPARPTAPPPAPVPPPAPAPTTAPAPVATTPASSTPPARREPTRGLRHGSRAHHRSKRAATAPNAMPVPAAAKPKLPHHVLPPGWPRPIR